MKSSGFHYVLIFLVAAAGFWIAQAHRRQGRPPSIYSGYRNTNQQETEDGGIEQRSLDNEEDFLNYNDKTSSPEATTPKGTFIGVKETVNGKDVYVFKGIPFAKPPVGSLRFKRPQMADKLEEPYEATTWPNSCSQVEATMFPGFKGEEMWNAKNNLSEDCLYLNIWVPAKIFLQKESEQASVAFWIHGGGFFSGSNSLDVYNGAVLAASQDLVVVSTQYRLGPEGFLYFGTDDAPGNMGMLDQTLSLQWTRENIEYFGGNPDSVTILGESCGSAAVGHHLVSPLSKSYFKRAIMMSGLPHLSYGWHSPEELKSASLSLARKAGCKQKSTAEIVECLRKIDAEKLVTLQWKVYKHMLSFPFTPTTDGYFLKDKPDEVIKSGKAKRGDLMIGSVEDEGTYFILYNYIRYLHHNKATSIPYDRFVDMMNEIFYEYSDAQKEAIISEYTNWENPEDGYANLHNLGEAVGDRWFTCENRYFADLWANRGLSVFYYHLTERLSANPWAKWMGVMHGDDVPLMFGHALKSNESFTPSEQQMTLNFMRLIGDYAKTGIPSPNWGRYTSEHPVYLDVNATTITDASSQERLGPKPNQCAFWNKILPLIKDNDGGKWKKSGMSGSRCGGQRPQWNSMGKGMHGGQGFFDHHHHEPHQDCSPSTKSSYHSYHGCSNFGDNKQSSVTTETSCKCSVEEGTTPTPEEEEEFNPNPPAV